MTLTRRSFFALAVVLLSGACGGDGTPTPPPALPSIPEGTPPCFQDDGPIAFYVDGVPVPEKTIARLVAFVRAAQPGVSVEQAQAHVVRRAAIPVAAAYAAGLKASEGGEAETTRVGKRALEALKRLRAGEAFEAVANDMTDDVATKGKGGVLPALTRSRFDQATLGDAIFSLDVGAFGGPVFTAFGAHVATVTEKTDGASPDMDRRTSAHVLFAYGGVDALKDASAVQLRLADLEAKAKVVLVNEAFKKSVPFENRK
jgi:hypothetical protein